MTSTSFNIGMSGDRNSSRVLKPPGGGHTNIFGEAEVKVNSPRPKYDQQNSTNLNFCMNSTDPNILVEQAKQEISVKAAEPAAPPPSAASPPASAASEKSKGQSNGNSGASNAAPEPQQANRGGGRVPPGGFSSGGFW